MVSSPVFTMSHVTPPPVGPEAEDRQINIENAEYVLWLPNGVKADWKMSSAFSESLGELLDKFADMSNEKRRKDAALPAIAAIKEEQSLSDMLDKYVDKNNGKRYQDAASQTQDLWGKLQVYRNPTSSVGMESSPPPAPLKKIKQEMKSPPSKASPVRKLNFGLLMLADAANALKPKPPSESGSLLALPSSEQLMICGDSDSGRSTGESDSGSPTMQQPEQRMSFIATDKLVFRQFNEDLMRSQDGQSQKSDMEQPKEESILPNSPTASSSNTSDNADKARKRRKIKEPLPCSFCGKVFCNQSSLRQHESFHRPARPFKCEQEKCDKAYKTKSELNRHLVVHSGEKKHFCKLCGKKFLRKQYLKTHLLRHHETGITMVTPSSVSAALDCATSSEATMMMTASGNVPVIVVPSAFVTKTEPLTWRCQLCMKIFVNNEDLKKHTRSYHEKKRP